MPIYKVYIPTSVLQGQTYARKVQALFGSALIGYWPLDETGGTVAYDRSGNGRNGTYADVTLSAAVGPDGSPCPAWPGNAGSVDIFSTGLRDALSVDLGSFFAWFKVSSVNVWTDNTTRVILNLFAGATNYIHAQKHSSNVMMVREVANSTSEGAAAIVYIPTAWAHLALTWNKAQNRAIAYISGAPCSLIWNQTAPMTGSWSGAITAMKIGASTVGANWSGNIAHVGILNKELTAAEIYWLANSTRTRIYRMGVLGDSISAITAAWESTVAKAWALQPPAIQNHAVAGARIAVEMAGQVTASATDNDDIIILALGTNDDNAGNMTTLQATYEAGIVALKASNPGAVIYAMNVLPRWANNTTGAEVDKGNIRTAIAAACTAQSITCWDTYTDPWIAQNQTSDGLHPTAAGSAAIAARVLALLPA